MNSFTLNEQAAIEGLRLDLTQRTHATLVTEYGQTDCGQSWAALCVDGFPKGIEGPTGPLVSILVGSGVLGTAALMAADGSSMAADLQFPDALKFARIAGIREFRAMRKGAYH